MDLSALIFAALKSGKTANERIDALPLPMVFKGTLGTGGTISTLPTASSSNEGFVYIVITDGTYAGQSASAGDMFISNGSAWVLVPSADEPSVIDDSVTSTALTWSSSKIASELGGLVKSFTYTGNGENPSTITFPSTPKFILGIFGPSDPGAYARIDAFSYGHNISLSWRLLNDITNAPTSRSAIITYEPDNDKIIHIEGGDRYRALNNTDSTYTVYYI